MPSDMPFPHLGGPLPPPRGTPSPTSGNPFPHLGEPLPPPRGTPSPTSGDPFPHLGRPLPPPRGTPSPTSGMAFPYLGFHNNRPVFRDFHHFRGVLPSLGRDSGIGAGMPARDAPATHRRGTRQPRGRGRRISGRDQAKAAGRAPLLFREVSFRSPLGGGVG